MVSSSIIGPSSPTFSNPQMLSGQNSNEVKNAIPFQLIRNRLPSSQSSCNTYPKKANNPYYAIFNNNFTEDELLEKVEGVFLSSPNLKASVKYLYQLTCCIKKNPIREIISNMPRLLESIHEHEIAVLSKIKFDEVPTELFNEINFCLKNCIRWETNENRKELKDIINNYIDYCSSNNNSCNQVGFFESLFYIVKYSSECINFIFNNIIKNFDVRKFNKEQLLLLLSIISFINIFNESSSSYLSVICSEIKEKLHLIRFNDVLFLLKRNDVKNKFCLDNNLNDFFNNDIIDFVENCFRYYMERTIFRDHNYFLQLNDINYVVGGLDYIETSLNSCSFLNEKIYSKQKVIFYLKLISRYINSFVNLSCDSLLVIHNYFLCFINDEKVDFESKEDLKKELIEIDFECLEVISNFKRAELNWWKKEKAMKIIATRLHIFYYLSLLKTRGGQAVLGELIDDLILFTENSSKSLLIHFVERAKFIMTSCPKYQDFWEYFYLVFKDQNLYLNHDEHKRKVECAHYKEILHYCQKNVLDGFLKDNFIHTLQKETRENGLKLLASLFLIYHTIHEENEFLDRASSEELCSLVDYLKKFTEGAPLVLNDFFEMIKKIDISGEHYRPLRDYLNGGEAVLEASSDSNKKSFETVDFESTNEMIDEVEDFNDRNLEVDSVLKVSRQPLSSFLREFLCKSVDEFLDEIVENIQEQRGKFLIPTELAEKIQNRAKKLFEDKSDSFASIPFKIDLATALSQALEVFLTPTASMPHKGVKRLSKSVPEEVLKVFVYGKIKETLWEVSGLLEHFDLKEKKMPVKAYYWKNNTEPFCYECSGYFDKEGRLVRLASTDKVRKYPVKDIQHFVRDCRRKLKGRIIANGENLDSAFILLYPKFTNRSMRQEALNPSLRVPKVLTSSTPRITSSAENWSQDSSKGASTILKKRLHQQVIDSTGTVVIQYPEPPNKKRAYFHSTFEPILKPYQNRAVKKVLDGWNDGKSGMILADKMGLGKTIELTKILFQLFRNNPKGTYACISTVSTCEQVVSQIKKFFVDFEIDELNQMIEDVCETLLKSPKDSAKDAMELVNLKNCFQKVKKLKKSHEDILMELKTQLRKVTEEKNRRDANKLRLQKRSLQLKKELEEERIERLKCFEDKIKGFANIFEIELNKLKSDPKALEIINHKEIFFQSKQEPDKADLLKGKIIVLTERKLEKFVPVFKTCKDLFLAVDEAHRAFNFEGQLAQAIQEANPAFLLLITGTPLQNRFQEFLMLLQHIKLVDQKVIFALEQILKGCTNRLANYITEPPTDENAFKELFEHLGKGFAHFELACEYVKTALVRNTRKEARVDWNGMLPTKQEITISCTLTEPASADILKADRDFFNCTREEGEVEKKFFNHYHMISRAIIHPDFIDHKAETAMLLLNEIFSKGSEEFLEWTRKSEVLKRFIDGEELKGFVERCEPTLIYADQEVVLQLLHKAIQVKFNLDLPIFNGTLTKNRRSEIIDQFKKCHNQPNLMLISCKAGGVGLDISSKNIVLFEQMFGLEREQVIGRSIRAGHQDKVMVYKIDAGTMTENHLKFLYQRKKNIAKYWLDMKERCLGERLELFLKMVYEGLNFFAQRQLSEGNYPQVRSHLIESLCTMIENEEQWYYEELSKIRNAAFSV